MLPNWAKYEGDKQTAPQKKRPEIGIYKVGGFCEGIKVGI